MLRPFAGAMLRLAPLVFSGVSVDQVVVMAHRVIEEGTAET